MTDRAPVFQFEFPKHAMDGVAASDDKLFRWAFWRIFDTSRPYLNFITLHPRSAVDPILEETIETHMAVWEKRRPRSEWKCGGYVVTSIFPRVAWNVEMLRRLNREGVDLVGNRGIDASMVFAKNACMIVMMPDIDAALDVRETHQQLVLSALTGVGVPVATVGGDGMLTEWKP